MGGSVPIVHGEPLGPLEAGGRGDPSGETDFFVYLIAVVVSALVLVTVILTTTGMVNHFLFAFFLTPCIEI